MNASRTGMWVAVCSVLVTLPNGYFTASAGGTQVEQASDALTPFLKRARAWAGGSAIDSVSSIEVVGKQSEHAFEFRLLLPDKFQVSHPESRSQTTLDAGKIWHVAGGLIRQLEPEDTARTLKNLTKELVTRSVTFLLKLPSGVSLSSEALGAVSLHGVSGEAVRVSGDEIGQLTLVFDSSDGRLLAYLDEGVLIRLGREGQPGQPTVTVHRLLDHQLVSGIRVPFRVDAKIFSRNDSTELGATTLAVDSVKLNSLTARDFVRPSGNLP